MDEAEVVAPLGHRPISFDVCGKEKFVRFVVIFFYKAEMRLSFVILLLVLRIYCI